MSIAKSSPTAVIDEATLALSTATVLADCTNTPLTTATSCVPCVELTFHASATGAFELTFYPTYDGTNYDTETWMGLTWSIAAPGNATPIRRHYYPVCPGVKGLKYIAENKDGTYAISNLKVFSTVQTAG